ncbi:MAG: hypothetical protein NW201_02720 [Gemmatimonadales bacterium]|nr:hypothetical protein [Gemmatimonadales bacterium]
MSQSQPVPVLAPAAAPPPTAFPTTMPSVMPVARLLPSELRALQPVLLPDEQVELVLRGQDEGWMMLWLATPERVLLVRDGELSEGVREIPYTLVEAVQQWPQRGRLMVRLFAGGRRHELVTDDRASAERFAEGVGRQARQHAGDVLHLTRLAEQGRVRRPSLTLALLRRLLDLRDRGEITGRDFEASKRRLLAAVS